MGIKLSQLLAQTRALALTLDFEDGAEPLTINLVYRPTAYTAELEAQLAAMDDGTFARSVAAVMSKIVESWDVVDDDGNVIPTTEEGLRVFPTSLLTQLLFAISKDLTINPQRGGISAAS